MRSLYQFTAVIWLLAGGAFIALAVQVRTAWLENQEPALLSGYILGALMLFLAAFNLRKRMSMVPVGRAAYWTMAHSVGGVLAIAIYFLHTGSLWPTGAYEQVLALLVYAVTLSGMFGYVFQRITPRCLTQSGIEVIYERVPAELSDIRDRVEELIREATAETGSDTLARHYLETLAWFFRRPRNAWSHVVGGRHGISWIRREFNTVSRYLNDTERDYLGQINHLATVKDRIDLHYAVQRVTKYWLFFHVPVSAALLVMAVWHVILVHVYIL